MVEMRRTSLRRNVFPSEVTNKTLGGLAKPVSFDRDCLSEVAEPAISEDDQRLVHLVDSLKANFELLGFQLLSHDCRKPCLFCQL